MRRYQEAWRADGFGTEATESSIIMRVLIVNEARYCPCYEMVL